MSDPRLIALASELRALGIPASYYSLGHQHNERMCLVFSEGKWIVYYSEHGDLAELIEFDSFEDAKANLLGRLQ
jgi:hypothetical protein